MLNYVWGTKRQPYGGARRPTSSRLAVAVDGGLRELSTREHTGLKSKHRMFTGAASSYRGIAGTTVRDRCRKALEIAGNATSGIVTALFTGAVGATGTPRQQCGVAEEVSFGSGPQTSSPIYWNCLRRTSAGIAASSIAWAAGTTLQE